MPEREPFTSHWEIADPSWFPRVLRVLAKEYPEINEDVWRKAVVENAMERNQEREC